MSVLFQDGDLAVRWSTAERLQALKQIVSRRAIAKALRPSRSKHRYCRRLPRWFMVWFVIALGLFGRDSYRQMFRWLHRFRRRSCLGVRRCAKPARAWESPRLRRLADDIIQLQGQPEMPHAFYGGMRLMAVDGFVLDVADTPENGRVFGRPGSGRSPGAFPQVRVLSLCEAGTHVLWRSLIKPCSCGEVPMARPLLRFLEENMLLLWDRGFLSYDLVQEVRQQGATSWRA